MRVIGAEGAAVANADLIGLRIDDEEVRRQAGGDGVVAERQVVVEVACRVGVADRGGAGRHGRGTDEVRIRIGVHEAGRQRRIGPRLRAAGVCAGIVSVAPAIQIGEINRQRVGARARPEVREGSAAAAARLIVGAQVGHGQLEFVEEAVLDDVAFVVVERRPLIDAARADVAHLERHVLGDRALQADGPRSRRRHLDVGMERVDVVGAIRADRNREGRCVPGMAPGRGDPSRAAARASSRPGRPGRC